MRVNSWINAFNPNHSAFKSFPLIYSYYKSPEKDDANLSASIQKLTLTNEESYHYTKDRIENSSTKKYSFNLFKSNPNTIDLSRWQALGLSPKQAQSIVNYRNKGGKFYPAADLQKMYAISPEMCKKNFCLM